MTALSTPAHSPAGFGRDTALRPVPWRKLAWVTWRQHRVTLAGVAGLLGALAVYLLITGLKIHHAYPTVTACHPAGSLACGLTRNNFNNAYWPGAEVTAALLQAVPALIGAFAGAPVLARELETGTFRFAWTQGFGRARWTAASWRCSRSRSPPPPERSASCSPGTTSHSSPRASNPRSPPRCSTCAGSRSPPGHSPPSRSAPWPGMLIRRVVPAMAATLAAWAGLALATAVYLRPHYQAPLITSNPNLTGPPEWVISQWYTGPHGNTASQSTISQILQGYHPAVTQIAPGHSQKLVDPVRWLAQHGYTQWTSYQPPGRFWTFQFIEGGWLLALSLLIIAATVWLVRRRAA